MSPRVSVLIPCYNAGRYVGAALDSVLAQTYQDFEIVVVDDGSTDDTAAVVCGYERVRYIYNAHSGIPVTRNLAVAKARGELIAFLDADDIWFPDKLSVQLQFMEEHDCPFSFTSYEYATPDGVGVAKIVRVPARITYREAIKNTTIFTSTAN